MSLHEEGEVPISPRRAGGTVRCRLKPSGPLGGYELDTDTGEEEGRDPDF